MAFSEAIQKSSKIMAVGAVGLNGSGKDTLIRHLGKRCGLEVLSLGEVARELAHLEDVQPTREKLHDVSQKYRARYGKAFFAKALIKEVETKSLDKVGITGIRTPTDVEVLKEYFGSGFLLIHVEAGDPKLRFERLKQRGEDRDPKTYEEFLEQEKNEEELFHLNDAIRQADVTIPNSGSREALRAHVEDLIRRDRFFQDLDCTGKA
jgi:dephospho-CoA kinase